MHVQLLRNALASCERCHYRVGRYGLPVRERRLLVAADKYPVESQPHMPDRTDEFADYVSRRTIPSKACKIRSFG